MALQLASFDHSADAAQALAECVCGDLQSALSNHARALLLVSGGRSPLPFFTALSPQPLAWSQIDLSLVDERSVPPHHTDANAVLVQQHLLVGAAAAARWLPLLSAHDAETINDPWALACHAADAANRNPALAAPAVVVLGIGTDGHTASLFADAPQWSEACTTTARYIALQPAQAPHSRISLSMSALRAQRNCYVWAVGSDKRATIDRCSVVSTNCTNSTVSAEPCALAALINARDVMLHVFYSDA